MKSRAGSKMDDNQKRAAVDKYIELRKTMTVREARMAVGGLAPDTVYKWAERFGLADKVKNVKLTQKRSYKKKPQLISIPVDMGEPIVTHQPRQQEAVAPKGNIIVLMGDAESVKSAMQTAFNVATHR